jgi:hypothetical protein
MCFVEVANGCVAFCYNNHFAWNCPCTLGFVDDHFKVLFLWALTGSWEPLVGIGFKFCVKEKSKESYPKRRKRELELLWECVIDDWWYPQFGG